MKIELSSEIKAEGARAVLVGENGVFSTGANDVEGLTSGVFSNNLKKNKFKADLNSVQMVSAPLGSPYDAFFALGLGAVPNGDFSKLDSQLIETAVASLYHACKSFNYNSLSVDLRSLPAPFAARALFALRLASYRFDKYFGAEKLEKLPKLQNIYVVCDDLAAAKLAYEPLEAIVEGVLFARDLVSEPANIIYPQSYADRVKEWEKIGLKVEVLGVPEMEKLGMHSLLGVGLGSARDSKLVVIQWLGADDKTQQPLAFVGKGVTFDTGGISIKPAEGMEDMKWDMGGSAAVAGAMVALAGRKAKANVVGILGLVENMPDGKAQRPGDVVKSMSGQTIEVINTDAEGRLVLADALWYCQDRFKPKFMIDLATLTGAIIIALGTDYAGVYSNNDDLVDKLVEASKGVSENLWRMPLPKQYEKQIDSKIADMRNIGGRPGGSITAALFLQRFVNNVPWVHMDIASTAWTTEQRIPTNPEGATGFGVRTLDALVAKYFEN